MSKAYRIAESLILKSSFARMIKRFVNVMVDELCADDV